MSMYGEVLMDRKIMGAIPEAFNEKNTRILMSIFQAYFLLNKHLALENHELRSTVIFKMLQLGNRIMYFENSNAFEL